MAVCYGSGLLPLPWYSNPPCPPSLLLLPSSFAHSPPPPSLPRLSRYKYILVHACTKPSVRPTDTDTDRCLLLPFPVKKSPSHFYLFFPPPLSRSLSILPPFPTTLMPSFTQSPIPPYNSTPPLLTSCWCFLLRVLHCFSCFPVQAR